MTWDPSSGSVEVAAAGAVEVASNPAIVWMGPGDRGGVGPTLPACEYRITAEVAAQKETTVGWIRERLR